MKADKVKPVVAKPKAVKPKAVVKTPKVESVKPAAIKQGDLKPRKVAASKSSSYLAPLIIGGALILFGIMFLLNNFNIVDLNVASVFAGIFVLAGLIFLIVFFVDQEQWWALIPGFVLMGVGATILVGDFVHLRGMDITGAVMLFFIALPFWVIFIIRRDYWWALFPAGGLTSIALMTVIPYRADDLGVAIMFLGWAITFLLVYFLARQKWAMWPAFGLGVMALAFLAGAFNIFGYIWPIAIICAGGYLIYRAMRK